MALPCLFCGHEPLRAVLSLGHQPLANAYLSPDQLAHEEPKYPLDFYVCPQCLLAQIEPVATSQEIFTEYAYFSSFSTSWLEHARRYVETITERLGLGPRSRVVEVASNDGYLLQYFQERGIPCLGIEPAANVARAAQAKGIDTRVAFFGQETAEMLAAEGYRADLVLGNNVLAHVPTLNDFVAGLKILLKPEGVVTMEFPHLERLVAETQFDTIYHEHFSYFSFLAVRRVFEAHGLVLFDVEQLPTHGGSLRIYGRHEEDESKPETARVEELLATERAAGMEDFAYYDDFAARVVAVREGLLRFLQQAKAEGKRVVGYGAPAKGNTLLNYCGIGTGLIEYTVDLSPHKQGLYLPGSRLPIRDREVIKEDRPDYLLILPWNLREEIMDQMQHIRTWDGKFVVAIPEVRILD